jgi:hypothetical protein
MSGGRRVLTTILFAALVVPAAAARQTPPGQSRNTPPPPSSGTAVISGVIVGDDSGAQPLRRVMVTLSPASSGAPTIQRMTTTDDRGRFVFAALPAGNYSTLSARKAGFVPMSYGQKRVGGMGMPISLIDGQHMAVDLKMIRSAVITGTVLDQGRPAVSVRVSATAVKITDGTRTPVPNYNNTFSTDDRGMYRIYGLAPGDYVVSATFRTASSSDLRPITEAELQWGRQQLQATGLNSAAGTSPTTSSAPPKPAPAVAYAPVFYPGTATIASASIVTLTAGQEQSGVDFGLQMIETAKVEGTVVGPDASVPQNVQINIVPKTLGDAAMTSDMFMLDMILMSRPTVTNGKFAIPAVRPGDYTIMARAARGTGAPAGRGAPAPAGRGGGPIPMTLWAAADVSVNGIDQSGIELRLQEGMDLSGKIIFDSATSQPPTDLSRISIRLGAAPTPGVTVAVNSPTGQPAADGTFTLQGVTPGRYLLSASSPGAVPGGSPGQSWVMKSAKVGDIDAADLAFEVVPGQNVSDVVITFTDKTSELSGTLLDANGKPTPEFSILLFPTDKGMWSNRSRRLRSPSRPGADGKFKFTNVLPGDYYLAALTDFEPQDVYKPEFLEQVAPIALKITIGEGEKKVQDLKIGGGS